MNASSVKTISCNKVYPSVICTETVISLTVYII